MKKKVGIMAVIALIFSVMFVVTAIATTGQAYSFWNLPSVLITIGGTFGAVLLAFPTKRLKTFGSVMKKPFIAQNFNLKEDIRVLVTLSEFSRREGLLSLEDHVSELTDDDFIEKGILLIVDGADEDQLRNYLEGSTYFMKQRHSNGAAMVNMVAATAPALGLMGTYVGLIPMLNSLDNPTTLGPMMALELVSSFYGAFIAYVIFSPIGKRLRFMSEEESQRRELLIEGLAAIQQGKNPKLIKEELCAYANIELDEAEEKEQQSGYAAGEVAKQA